MHNCLCWKAAAIEDVEQNVERGACQSSTQKATHRSANSWVTLSDPKEEEAMQQRIEHFGLPQGAQILPGTFTEDEALVSIFRPAPAIDKLKKAW